MNIGLQLTNMEMKLNALQINLQRFIRNVRFVFVVSRWWETRELEWDCPKCGAHLEAEDVSRSINPDDYMTCNLEPDEDYGEYKYMEDDDGSRAFLAGAPGYEIDFFHLI